MPGDIKEKHFSYFICVLIHEMYSVVDYLTDRRFTFEY